MKFWIKLIVGIILGISVVLTLFRYLMIRQNFINSIEASSIQNSNQHTMQKYYLESNILSKIEVGEEVLDEHIIKYIDSLYSYVQDDLEKVAVYSEDKSKIFSNFERIDELNIGEIFNKEKEEYVLRNLDGKNYMVFVSYFSTNNRKLYIVNIYDITAIYKEREKQVKEIMYSDIVVLSIAALFVIAIFNIMSNDIENKINSLNLSLKKKDDFITGFSHEIKTPMTAIIGYSDLLRLKKCDEEVNTKSINYIYQEAKRLEELSYKLLALMELSDEKLELKKVDIKSYILKISKKILLDNINLKIDMEPAIVLIDESLMEIVIRNLVQNAQKANPKDNTIYIEGIIKESSYILSVKDNGIGIPKEHLERVTEDFYMVDKSRSRKNGGTGIGLSLCKKILEFHNSKIQIESIQDVGTRVYFELEVLDGKI